MKSVVLLFLLSSSLFAGEIKNYSSKLYEKAVMDQKKVVLDFHADWCGTCVKQGESLKTAAVNAGDDLVIFKVDYDKEKLLKKEFGVTKQSTLILLEKGKEKGRVMGITDLGQIEDFIN